MVKNVHHVGIPSEFREDMGASTVVIEIMFNVKVLHFDMIRFFNRLFDYNVVMIVGTKWRSIFFQFFDLRRSDVSFWSTGQHAKKTIIFIFTYRSRALNL